MTKLDAAIEDLKALPPSNLERTADYIDRLKRITDQERQAIIDRTAGSLTREEADELERIIAEGCQQLDEHDRKRPAQHASALPADPPIKRCADLNKSVHEADRLLSHDTAKNRLPISESLTGRSRSKTAFRWSRRGQAGHRQPRISGARASRFAAGD
jgi:hypothetical protein